MICLDLDRAAAEAASRRLTAAAEDSPLAQAVLTLHALVGDYGPRCGGCDQGCSCDAAEWPCSTVELVAGVLGVRLEDGTLEAPC